MASPSPFLFLKQNVCASQSKQLRFASLIKSAVPTERVVISPIQKRKVKRPSNIALDHSYSSALRYNHRLFYMALYIIELAGNGSKQRS